MAVMESTASSPDTTAVVFKNKAAENSDGGSKEESVQLMDSKIADINKEEVCRVILVPSEMNQLLETTDSQDRQNLGNMMSRNIDDGDKNSIHRDEITVGLIHNPTNSSYRDEITAVELIHDPTNSSHRDEITTVELIRDPTEASGLRLLLEVILPFLLAGVGTVFAGVLLGNVREWPAFKALPEMLILVPPLLGLKGNLEMTLASRLSTQANLGNMDSWRELWRMIYGNLALTQLQATCLGLVVAVGTMLLDWLPRRYFDYELAIVLSASSVCTATAASLVLGAVMVLVIACSRKLCINPDNIATPIAASLGDLTTVFILGWLSHVFYESLDGSVAAWLNVACLTASLLLVPVWILLSRNNPYTRPVLYEGWSAFAGALTISSVCGLIFSATAKRHHDAVVFQPIINGVGGNLVAIQASRLSTSLHCRTRLGELPDGQVKGCPNLRTVFFCRGSVAVTGGAGVLLLLVVPGHMLFTFLLKLVHPSDLSLSPVFCSLYLLAAFIQVLLLLYFCVWLVHQFWIRKLDPDNFSIPYLTALGDLLGAVLLAGVFKVMDVVYSDDASQELAVQALNSTTAAYTTSATL